MPRLSGGGNRQGRSGIAAIADLSTESLGSIRIREDIVAILVCRVAWMPRYRSNEEVAVGGGRFVAQGNVPHESLNFLRVGETYYGFVENRGQQIRLERLGGEPEDETVDGVLVVFCAEEPQSREFLVTGWYNNATVYRRPIERPRDDLGRSISFTAGDATLVDESDRCFRVPRARDNPPSGIGGIGMRNVWYGLNEERAEAFRERLGEYIGAPSLTRTPQEAVELRQRRASERLERRGTYRQFIRVKGYRCEACDWSIDESETAVWGSSFELHHLTPVHELRENEIRLLRIEDFVVLRASCHRAIHRTDFVSDVGGFAAAHC